MRLRYIGVSPVAFNHPMVGAVEPGDEFEVPDDQTEPLLRRADVVQVPPVKPKARKTPSEPAAPSKAVEPEAAPAGDTATV
jgi:hypothetical protein